MQKQKIADMIPLHGTELTAVRAQQTFRHMHLCIQFIHWESGR